jgi:hypothetical protein
MMNIVKDTYGVANSNVPKFGGWDEIALIKQITSYHFAKEFPTVPGTWTLTLSKFEWRNLLERYIWIG